MSFDEDNNKNEEKKSTTFFGLELSDAVVYTVVVILTLIFIRQVSIVLEALG